MKIDLRPIRQTPGAQSSFSFTDILLTDRLHEAAPWLATIPLIEGKIIHQGNELVVVGKIYFTANGDCNRCLLPLTLTSEVEFEENFQSVDDENNDTEAYRYSGDELELETLVEDYLLIGQPSGWLCKEDCPGFCPTCGADLTAGKCQCEKEVYNPKFGKLALLKDKLSK